MVKKRAKSVVCAAVFFLMAVPSPVWAGEEESLQVENRIVLDKVEIVLESFRKTRRGREVPGKRRNVRIRERRFQRFR